MDDREQQSKGLLAAMRKHWILSLVVGLAAVAVAGLLVWSVWVLLSASGEPRPVQIAGKVPADAEVWTCSMHPQIRKPGPGQCPICGMDLVRVTKGAAGLRQFTTSEAGKALMDVETSRVERKFVTAEVRMSGKVDYDETRLAYVTAWVPGRIDRMFVDYTGVPVRKGDHMVELYSPDLLDTQQALLEAIKAVEKLKASDIGIVRHSAEALVEDTRERLRLWGLTPEQIAAIEKRGKAADRMTIHSPVGGIVIKKEAKEGMYVQTGTRIYTIADLSRVWVKLDAYESDLMWLRIGQKVSFTTVSYPGDLFAGTVAFIDPVLSSRTRTVKVRVNAANPDGKLKPGMFVKAVLKADVAASGKVMDADLAGKWMCPMHPSVIKADAGNCDICGMPLVRTESLGYLPADPAKADKPLVIPASAVLRTGTRAIVYIEVDGAAQPTYEGREIILGPRAGDYYIVHSGLKEGQRVVKRGSFKIDSALQIQARPSMMSPEGAGAAPHEHGKPGKKPHEDKLLAEHKRPARRPPVRAEFHRQLYGVFEGYFEMQRALASDRADSGVSAVKRMQTALGLVEMKLLSGDDHTAWMKHAGELKKILAGAAAAKGIEPLRKQFALLSEELLATAKRLGPPGGAAIYQMRCPMAFNNRGAVWLQLDKDVRNPYFGAAMPECGGVQDVLRPAPAETPATVPARPAGGQQQ